MISGLVTLAEYDDTEEGILAEIGATSEMVLLTLTEAEDARLTEMLDGARVTPDPLLKMAYLRSARLFCREAQHRARLKEMKEAARLRADRFYRILLPLLLSLLTLIVVSAVLIAWARH